MREKVGKNLCAGRACRCELPPSLPSSFPPPISPRTVPCAQHEAEDAAGCDAVGTRRDAGCIPCAALGAATRAGCGAGAVSGLQLCPWESNKVPGSARGLCFSPCPWLFSPFVLVGSETIPDTTSLEWAQTSLEWAQTVAFFFFFCLQPHPELQMRSVIYVFMLF